MTTFRFWGSVDPRGRQKLPVVASVPVVDGDGWTLQLYEPIDSWGGEWGTSAAEFASALRPIPADARITLRINSPGGEVYEAVAIANLLRERPGGLDVKVDGLAASAASYLAVMGETVTMGRDAELMVHKPWGIAIGDDDDMTAMAARLGALGENLARAYADKAGGDVAQWLATMKAETWYTAAEAVTAGLADAVLGESADDDAELPAAASLVGSWSLTGLSRRRPAAGPSPGRTEPPAPAPAPADPPPDPAPAPAPVPVAVFDPEAFRASILEALEGSTK